MKTKLVLSLLACLIFGGEVQAQLRDFAVHRRGMLRETIFNTGEIGRAYDGGTGGSARGVPSCEWPSPSDAVVDGVSYNGQYNSFGGGVYFSATRSDTSARLFSYCGAANNEPVAGRFAFPIMVKRFENFPVLADGGLNPAYNPDEAEEIIISQWGTNIGLTVTRTSRAWSLPDYDDFIIYEYEIEATGEVDGDAGTPGNLLPLTDVIVAFAYGFGPSMFGYERKFNRWDGTDYSSLDQFPRFDRRRWMNYNLDRDGKPDAKYFAEWTASQKFGGGLLSPQAPGFLPLYYDTTHLARKGNTLANVAATDTVRVWDENGHLKQPWLNRMETINFTIPKVQPYLDVIQTRKNNPYRDVNAFGPDWVGRGSYNWRQSQKFGTGHILGFGPYILNHGEKIRFAVAEVVGYGAARLEESMAGLTDEGGSCGELCGEPTSPASNAFNPVPNWYQPRTYGGVNGTAYEHGSNYLSIAPLPQYVNSNTVTVREVADRAIEMYTGQAFMDYDTSQYWPERSPDRGVYKVAITVPAPAITVSNTSSAENEIVWGPQVESFSVPRLLSSLHHYELCKASHPLGPWTRIDSIGVGDVRYLKNGVYKVVDSGTRVGESFYYSVVSVDGTGNRSGRSNLTLHQTQIGGTETLGTVHVVPNPFVVRSGFSGTTSTGGDAGGKIGFYNLPKHCTIRVISYSGQLVQTIVHESELYSTEYMQVTRNNQVMASGVYFYVVETPDGTRTSGRFVIIH